LVWHWVCSPMVTGSSPLRTTYPRQSLVPIVVHVPVRCCMFLRISRGARIFGTLVQTPNIINQKKKNINLCIQIISKQKPSCINIIIYHIIIIITLDKSKKSTGTRRSDGSSKITILISLGTAHFSQHVCHIVGFKIYFYMISQLFIYTINV
jgi:hypothetical protein